jgi:hypothetical protein
MNAKPQLDCARGELMCDVFGLADGEGDDG